MYCQLNVPFSLFSSHLVKIILDNCENNVASQSQESIQCSPSTEDDSKNVRSEEDAPNSVENNFEKEVMEPISLSSQIVILS